MAAKGNMGDPKEQEQLGKFDAQELARLYTDIANKSVALLTQMLSNGSSGAPRSMADTCSSLRASAYRFWRDSTSEVGPC